MADEPRQDETASFDTRGPILWLNWVAEAVGQPARTQSKSAQSILIRPSWEEYSLFSDTYFTLAGDGKLGPYSLLLSIGGGSKVGSAGLALVLRSRDHLAESSSEGPHEARDDAGTSKGTDPVADGDDETLSPASLVDPNEDTTGYVGGSHGEQMASLLSLALSRRLRSAGVTRHGFDTDVIGTVLKPHTRSPTLAPGVYRPVLPRMDKPALLDDAEPYLLAYSELSAKHAVAVQRAAHQFADALWWSEADPRISWIKLFGAIEAAADTWDLDQHEDPVAQLTTRHPGLVAKLLKKVPDALPIVAKSLSRVIGAERKMIQFVIAHLPDPPAERPGFAKLDYTKLEEHLNVLYDHRSRELHGGIPIPPALCEAPSEDNAGVAIEVFAALATSEGGGYWPAERLPMYLHTFAHVTGGALRKWWLQLPRSPHVAGTATEAEPSS